LRALSLAATAIAAALSLVGPFPLVGAVPHADLAASLGPAALLGPVTVAHAADACTTEDLRATTCRLTDGAAREGSLSDASATATYRVDALAPHGSLDLTLTSEGGSAYVAVLDWHGAPIAETVAGDSSPELHLHADLPLAGAYAVIVKGLPGGDTVTYRLSAKLASASDPPAALWPTTLATGDGPLTGERQMLRTPRGGSPEGGVAVARALRAPPEGVVDDFTMVTDVQFDQIVGPSALSIRFRYEPEAGGGTGYVLEIDPFAGTASLDSFDEGQRRPIANKVALPVVPGADGPSRLVLQATGPSITLSVDGQSALDITDDRFARGLIVVGVVTWTDPVAVTFDHIQVTGPAR
jgi:hypothetical protein